MPETTNKTLQEQITWWSDQLTSVKEKLEKVDIRSSEYDTLMSEKQNIRIKIMGLKARVLNQAVLRKELFGEEVIIPRELRLSN